MPRLTDFAPIAAFSLAFLAADVNDASAQSVPTLRVVAETATVRTRPALLGGVVAKAEAGTMLEALDLDNGWYWVILPPNEHGTRLPGWILEHDVETVGAGEPDAVLHHFSEAVAESKARMEAEAAEQEARLEQARLRVEEARREYEAVTKSAAGASAPAAATGPAPPAASQAGPARVPRAEKPRASVGREYQWFAGYSFYRDQSDDLSFPAGWALSAARHATPEIEIVGAISGSHKSADAFGVNLASTSIYTFAGGPKYARRTGSVTSFGQVLVGVAATRTSALGVSDSSAGFALLPGGGVDIPITKTLALRAGLDVQTVHGSGGWFTGFRINTGLMFVTGSAK